MKTILQLPQHPHHLTTPRHWWIVQEQDTDPTRHLHLSYRNLHRDLSHTPHPDLQPEGPLRLREGILETLPCPHGGLLPPAIQIRLCNCLKVSARHTPLRAALDIASRPSPSISILFIPHHASLPPATFASSLPVASLSLSPPTMMFLIFGVGFSSSAPRLLDAQNHRNTSDGYARSSHTWQSQTQ